MLQTPHLYQILPQLFRCHHLRLKHPMFPHLVQLHLQITPSSLRESKHFLLTLISQRYWNYHIRRSNTSGVFVMHQMPNHYVQSSQPRPTIASKLPLAGTLDLYFLYPEKSKEQRSTSCSGHSQHLLQPPYYSRHWRNSS